MSRRDLPLQVPKPQAPLRTAVKQTGASSPGLAKPSTQPRSRALLLVFCILAAVLFVCFFESFQPGYTLFSNDGPLGRLMSQCQRLPQRFAGAWQDLNSIGYSQGAAWPNVTSLLLLLLGPVSFSKFYAPLALLILGLSAWCFFRQLGLSPLACTLGALASSLNSGFFSAACWGIAAHPLSAAMSYLALAALVRRSPQSRWLKAVVAGTAVGIGVAEGADVGAMFSLYVGVFALYHSLGCGFLVARKWAYAIGEVAVMAGMAGLVAAQALSMLTQNQLEGIQPGQPGTSDTQARWDWATKWSLPKREALTLIIPGLFGYRMDAANGGQYWGAVGREPAWDRYFANGRQGDPPTGFLRFAGGGNYAGVLVVLVAIWAGCQAMRGERSVFRPETRRNIYFWIAVGVISLLLAFGRHAPFYRFLYQLPHAASFRNPAKFIHIVNWALLILFAYGVQGLSHLYLSKTAAAPLTRSLGRWWTGANRFERQWFVGCTVAVAVSLLGAVAYAYSSPALENYLQTVGFDENAAREIAAFSFHEVSWYLVFLASAVVLVLAVSTGQFKGRASRWAVALLGLLLVVDLGRANRPWIVYWNYAQKYASDPIIDFLRQTPYEHRVASVPPWLPHRFSLPENLLVEESHWDDIYQAEWLQHLFPYYDIQSLDVVQLRTIPPDLQKFEQALQFLGTENTLPLIVRRWQLTNTRYLLGSAGLLPLLNQALDPVEHRFTIVSRFDFMPKPGILHPAKYDEVTSVPSRNGSFALFEFTGALPRAALYSDWQVSTNDEASLRLLTNSAFNPARTVLVSSPTTQLPASAQTTQANGSVTFVHYAPTQILLRAAAPVASVLLLDDHYNSDWKVSLDGQTANLLRCNFIMRGVAVPAGNHDILFQFRPRLTSLYISLVGLVMGLVLTGVLLLRTESLADALPRG